LKHGGTFGNVMVLVCAMTLIVCLCAGFTPGEGVGFIAPKGWKPPVYSFASNPLTKKNIELGRMLFHDPILSRDSMVSCASCHQPRTAFAHTDHDVSHGIGDAIGTRNAPALMNLAWQPVFHWDGAIHHLEVQPLAPMTHPQEMGETLDHVLAKLNATQRFKTAFAEAFSEDKSAQSSAQHTITTEQVLKVLAQFQVTLVSANAKYDRVMRAESGWAFNEFEQQGYRLYTTHCSSCHTEPLFTNHTFQNNGLPIDTMFRDIGRMAVTQRREDSLTFKVPTLRNVEVTYPYMHDGRFQSLAMVLFHYTNGIHLSPTLAPALRDGIRLSEEEKRCIIAFLKTLTDEEFLEHPAFQAR
jgi:cytochrome c peroxidase